MSSPTRTTRDRVKRSTSPKAGKDDEAAAEASITDEFFFSSEHDIQFLERLHKLKLVGNMKQKKMLKQSLERVKKGGMSEVIFIHGESGVGKSKMAEEVLRKQTKPKGPVGGKRSKSRRSPSRRRGSVGSSSSNNNNSTIGTGLFVSGKFDLLQSNSDHPYAALVSIFSGICDLMGQSQDETNKRQVRENLSANLSEDETAILVKLIPNLVNLTTPTGLPDPIEEAAAETDPTSLAQAFARFKLLFRKFLRAVATKRQPIILFFDDLQWADTASIEVFKSICSDMESTYVLIVGAYRDDDDEYEPPNLETILPCSNVHIQPLPVEDVNHIVSVLTGMPPKKTLPLGQVVHAKTRGNAQFVKLFLESLCTERLLTYSVAKGKWEYDIHKVMDSTTDASNVLIAAKIERLGDDVQDVLKFASCLGFMFDLDHLRAVVVAEHEHLTGKKRLPGTANLSPSAMRTVPYEDTLLKLIEKSKKHGILTSDGRQPSTKTFSFSHDKLFEAVYASLPTGLERQQLHVRIGRLLLDAFPTDEFVSFLAVDHLNQGSSCMTSPSERLQLAKHNLSVAKLSIDKYSAFGRANDFVVAALSLFPSEDEDLWTYDYHLALDLHTIGAQSSVVGASPESYVNKVALNGKSLHDKIPLYTILMNFYGWQNKMDSAIEVGLEMMKLLGEKTPRNAGKLRLAWEFVMANRAIGWKSDLDILATPNASSWRDAAVLATLREIATAAYFTQPDLMIAAVIRGLRFSVEHELCSESTPVYFAMYGSLLFHVGKEKEGLRFLNLSLAQMDKETSRYSSAITVTVAYGLGLHYRQRLETMYQPLVDGYTSGEKYGDTGYALICANLSCVVKLMIGAPLGEVEKLLDRYIGLMKAYNRSGVLVLTCPFHQRVLNLMGRSSGKATTLAGTAMIQDELLHDLKESGNDVAVVMLLDHIFQMHCIFEEWAHALKSYERLKEYSEAIKTLDTHFYWRQHRFFHALLCLVWYRKTGEKKYKKSASRVLQLMKNQQAAGCPNYDCFIPILVAEQLWASNNVKPTSPSKDRVHSAYWKAADACKYVHLKALAHERAATAMESWFEDKALAKEHLLAAKRQYMEWQALAKVKHIDGKLKYFV